MGHPSCSCLFKPSDSKAAERQQRVGFAVSVAAEETMLLSCLGFQACCLLAILDDKLLFIHGHSVKGIGRVVRMRTTGG